MRILVTGAASMLMHAVATALHSRGDQVVCLQRREITVPDGVEVVRGDLRDRAVVERAVQGCEAVVHGAARVGVLGTREDFASVNVEGTRLLIETARRGAVSRFVHVSTPSVAHVGHSLVGEVATPARTGRRGGAHYAETKAIAETLALGANDAEMGVVALRPHLVWGPGDTQLVGRIVAAVRRGRLPLIGAGRALVDTTYLDNAVDAFLAALDTLAPNSSISGRAYVIANGEPRPVRDLLMGICAALDVEVRGVTVPTGLAEFAGGLIERLWPRLSDTEPPLTRFVAEQLATAHWFDLTDTMRDLSWTPRIGVDEGLRRLASPLTATVA